MGHYAAKCMYNHLHNQPVYMDICFELFSHVTKFFGFKVGVSIEVDSLLLF